MAVQRQFAEHSPKLLPLGLGLGRDDRLALRALAPLQDGLDSRQQLADALLFLALALIGRVGGGCCGTHFRGRGIRSDRVGRLVVSGGCGDDEVDCRREVMIVVSRSTPSPGIKQKTMVEKSTKQSGIGVG